MAGVRVQLLLDVVLRTKGIPVVRQAYYSVYWCAIACVRFLVRFSPITSALYIYRGWVTGDWQPGISDLDFHYIYRRGRNSGADEAMLGLYGRRYRIMRKLFPMLGEFLVSTGTELAGYLGNGGGRAQEFALYSRVLLGQSSAFRDAVPPANPIADMTEALHAYTRLMNLRFLHQAEHPIRAQQNVRKAFIDLMRYCESSKSGHMRLRREFEADKAKIDDRARLAIAETDIDYLCSAAFWELENASEKLLEKSPPVESARPSDIRWMPSAESQKAEEHGLAVTAARTFDEFFNHFGWETAGVLLDDRYRLQVVLEPATQDRQLSGFWKEFDVLRKKHSFLGTLPMILPRSAWEFLLQSSYLHHPTAFIDASLSDGLDFAGGKGLTGFQQLRYHLPPFRRQPNRGCVYEAAVQSFWHLAISWRAILQDEAWPNAAHHLYTRVLGLRLFFEKGIGMSFSRLNPVLEVATEHFPETSGWIGSMEFRDPTRRSEHYAFLDEQMKKTETLQSLAATCTR